MPDTGPTAPGPAQPEPNQPGQTQPGSFGPPMPAPPPPGSQHGGAAKPGVIPLRPLGLGEILDGAISTMRTRPLLMLGVTAIVVTITQLIVLGLTFPVLDEANQVIDRGSADEAELARLLGLSLAVTGVGLLFAMITWVFLSGFITQVVGSAVLGRSMSFGETWAQVRPRMLPLLGLVLLYTGVVVAAAVLLVLFAIAYPQLGILAIVLVGIPVGLWLIIRFSLATPALVLESVGVTRAFGRSRELVQGAWWRIFGITLLAWVIAFILTFIIALPFELLGGGFETSTATEPVMPSGRYLVLSTIGAIIGSTLTQPFTAAVTVLLYTDQRMRREGLDIELARTAGTAG